jgi:hypothetical protein
MQKISPTQIPTADHLGEAAIATDEAIVARREWKASELRTEELRQRYVGAVQRANVLSREAAEIEGAAA